MAKKKGSAASRPKQSRPVTGGKPSASAAYQKAARLKAQQAQAARRRRLIIVCAGLAALVVVGVIVAMVVFNQQKKEATTPPAGVVTAETTEPGGDATSGSTATTGGDEPTATATETALTPPATSPKGATSTGGIRLGVNEAGELVPGGEVPKGDDVVTVDVVSDFLCPACLRFEQLQIEDLHAKAKAGEIILVEHPLGYLNSLTDPAGYSSRAAAAAAAVAAYDPDHYVAFTQLLWDHQPAEGGPGLTDQELADYATQAGVPDSVTSLFPSYPLGDWVDWATQVALYDEAFSGTPLIRLSVGGGALQKWSAWAMGYEDENGQTVLVPGDLDAAIANVKAGDPPDGAEEE
ncbi:MAG: thioredoxin domain-containing protein [Bifidobacteriaceae bacterium]|jgi:protein-disulfide isomerase|nr:thioredoxin domain-containing protein [Bifidobacteriaceae bacterium]